MIAAIRDQVRARALSIGAVETGAGLVRSYLSRVERGRGQLGLDDLFRILDALRLSPKDFFDLAFMSTTPKATRPLTIADVEGVVNAKLRELLESEAGPLQEIAPPRRV